MSSSLNRTLGNSRQWWKLWDSAAPADGNSLDPPHGQKDFKKRKKDKGRLMPAPIVPPGTREQAFVSAISSSGVAHAVTRACSGGMLRECGCDESLRGRSADGFKWSGCSDNIGYGTMFSKSFVDAKDLRVSRRKREKYAKELEQSNGKRKRGTSRRMAPVARALMNLHNNDAGREIIAQNMKVDCKCHGVSGSCEMKTCWRSMPNFREIGEVLKDKFDGASEVRAEMVGNKINLVPRDQGFKPYGKSDLIYINRSPDFCEYNPHRGSLGTHGRQCNKVSFFLFL
ncbi:unnamed protein product [Notodromas monacha]|uniref:Protein Wnt n=1 Tax=Notodromas monacha TaxID=399045 RepID=A0A7R9GJR7_9CRUS|nr:unnamed protein product [Notodromas monacha]CAG0923859.1 unnamed protein product [Notodromas monacha]